MAVDGAEQPQKVQYLQACTGIADPLECTQILEAHSWDLDAAVATVLAITDNEGASSSSLVLPPSLRSRNGAPPSSSSGPPGGRATEADAARRPSFSGRASAAAAAAPLPTPDLHGNSGRPLGRRGSMWRLVSLPLRLLTGSLGILLGAVKVGVKTAGGLLAYVMLALETLATWAAGGPQPYSRRALGGGATEAEVFRRLLAAEYGPAHPPFVDLPFAAAVRRAAAEFKFVFVYLHSAEHADTPAFCRRTLCTPAVAELVAQHFVPWGGDVRGSEGYRLSNSLRASTFPFCAVVASSSSHSQRVALLQQVEGPKSPEELLGILRRVVEEQGAMLVAARAEAEERDLSRRLREEQDAAYQDALRADQERERKRAEDAERQRSEAEAEARRVREEEERARLQREAVEEQQAALARWREQKAASLGAEPERGRDVTQVLIRMPGGERKERRFHSDASVQSVYDYVDSLGLLPPHKYRLVSNFPRTVYGPDTLPRTLRDTGLHPHASLFVQEDSEEP